MKVVELRGRVHNAALIEELSHLNAAPPPAIIETCVIHLIRCSMGFASWNRESIAQAQRAAYRAEMPDASAEHLPYD